MRQKVITHSSIEPDRMIMPVFVPTLYMTDYPLLSEAVSELSGTPVMERIIREWIGVANKLLMAWNIDLDDPDLIRKGVFAASSLLNAGIEVLVKHSGQRPAACLAETALENIARLAISKMRKLASRAGKLFSKEWSTRYMPSHWQDMARGLLMSPPLVWDEKEMDYRHVKSLNDIRRLKNFLDEAEKWLILLERVLPPCSSWQKAINWTDTNYENDRGFTWESAIATIFINCITGEGAFMLPLSRQQITDASLMLHKALKTDGSQTRDVFIRCIGDKIEDTGLSEGDLDIIFEKSVKPFINELKGCIIDGDDIPDDYINSKSVLIEKTPRASGEQG
jgi:hypothetical protein